MERRKFILRSMQAGAAIAIPFAVSCSKDEDDDILLPGKTTRASGLMARTTLSMKRQHVC